MYMQPSQTNENHIHCVTLLEEILTSLAINVLKYVLNVFHTVITCINLCTSSKCTLVKMFISTNKGSHMIQLLVDIGWSGTTINYGQT